MYIILFASLALIQTCDAFPFNFFTPNNVPMEDMLDMIQQLMTGDAQFDRNFIKEIRTCMATFDPELPDVHDKIWQGMIDYWDMGGNPDDPWGGTDTPYAEDNVTVSSYRKMTIHEPCNVASNVAYYHLLMELCKRRADGNKFTLRPEYITGLGKTVANFPAASSLFHGSHTKLGPQQDDGTIQIMAYLMHQGIMEALPHRSSILNDLSLVPRPLTALQIVDAAQKMYSTESVDKWYNTYAQFDLPDYFMGFAGFGMTLAHIFFGDTIVRKFSPIFLDMFDLTSEQQQFLRYDFLPELKEATKSLNRKDILRNNFLGNSVGAVAKMMHAFVWQEFMLINHTIILKPIPNMIGSVLIPKLIKKLNVATNYEYFQPDFQRGVNVYPGEQWCNPRYAHAKWHVINANALIDLFYIANDMTNILAPS